MKSMKYRMPLEPNTIFEKQRNQWNCKIYENQFYRCWGSAPPGLLRRASLLVTFFPTWVVLTESPCAGTRMSLSRARRHAMGFALLRMLSGKGKTERRQAEGMQAQ